MSLLDTLLQMFAYSLVVVPVAVLIIGVVLFVYKPIYRLMVGILLVALGSFGLAIYSFSFYMSFTTGRGIMVSIGILIVEILTIITGIISILERSRKNLKFWKSQSSCYA